MKSIVDITHFLQLLKENNCIIISRDDANLCIDEKGNLKFTPVGEDWMINKFIESYGK